MNSRIRVSGTMASVLVAAIIAFCLAAGRQSGASGAATGGEGKMTNTELRSDSDWKKVLTPMQYRVLRERGTERAFTGEYVDNRQAGVYKCAGCGQPLFESDDKFTSGCGWPSFTKPAEAGKVSEHTDTGFGMTRTEIRCSKCDGHLGHVFPDGPKPTGMRYCINSAALSFSKVDAAPEQAASEPVAEVPSTATATFGAGCFWCVEAAFEMLAGVVSVKSGYMGGTLKNPSYKQVCAGDTGHAEVAQVTYDTGRVSFEELLRIFWIVHDPTTLNRQGGDVGTQYRSVIFYHSPEQRAAAEKAKQALEKSGKFSSPIVTEIAEASQFYEAEDYHQDYFNRHSTAPYCRAVIEPKLKKVRAATDSHSK